MTEQESKALNESIRLAEVLTRLENTAEFKEIILDGFIEAGTKGCVAALAYAGSEDQKKRLLSKLEAIANLQAFLADIKNTAINAKHMLEESAEEEGDEE